MRSVSYPVPATPKQRAIVTCTNKIKHSLPQYQLSDHSPWSYKMYQPFLPLHFLVLVADSVAGAVRSSSATALFDTNFRDKFTDTNMITEDAPI